MIGNMDIALSSRVRYARNIEGFPFSNRMSASQKEELIELVSKASPKELMLVKMSTMPMRERLMLVERHMISPDMADNDNGAALINRDETISILICEEDHLRIQCIEAGFALEKANEISSRLDRELSAKLDFAFDSKLGYLTACPTNLGTGMRASVMVHLPILFVLEEIKSLGAALNEFGCIIRGFYGERSDAPGHIYQISNQLTLGLSEDDILKNLTKIARRVILREESVREQFYEKGNRAMEDSVYRALGTLRFAHYLSLDEAMECISRLKVGSSLGLLPVEAQGILNKLIVDIQDACIDKREGMELNDDDRLLIRANYVRNITKDIEKMYNDMEQRGENW